MKNRYSWHIKYLKYDIFENKQSFLKNLKIKIFIKINIVLVYLVHNLCFVILCYYIHNNIICAYKFVNTFF